MCSDRLRFLARSANSPSDTFFFWIGALIRCGEFQVVFLKSRQCYTRFPD